MAVKPFVAAALVMVVVAACAAGGARKAMAPSAAQDPAATAAPEAGAGASPMPASPREEIEQLSDAIEQRRGELGLTEPAVADPPVMGPAQRMSTTPLSTDQTCKPAKTDRCKTSCTLSDSICTNAARICEIAADMRDDWAAQKCGRAKQVCATAHENCCTCE